MKQELYIKLILFFLFLLITLQIIANIILLRTTKTTQDSVTTIERQLRSWELYEDN